MLPLLAASTAIGAVDKLASLGSSVWKGISGGGHADASKANSAAGDSFASLLSANGVSAASLQGVASPVRGAVHAAGHGRPLDSVA